MPANRNALIRYKTIDLCLRNRFRKWTLKDLIKSCSEALYEYEEKDSEVSKRTVQLDIQTMRSSKLGYNAPIVVVDRKYYTYEDPEYSITNIPLTTNDLDKLSEVVEILKQFKGFSHFQEMSGIVQRLEDKIYTSQTQQHSIIDFEKNEQLKGLAHISPIYQAIQQQETLEIGYQSFNSRRTRKFIFYPYLLKEYRNRWFVLGQRSEWGLITLALDRIQNVKNTTIPYLKPPKNFDTTTYYNNVIGVTKEPEQQAEKIHLWVDATNTPYVLTKPLHQSQKRIKKSKKGIEITLEVVLNKELERLILGFGAGIEVLAPQSLRTQIQQQLVSATKVYEIKKD